MTRRRGGRVAKLKSRDAAPWVRRSALALAVLLVAGAVAISIKAAWMAIVDLHPARTRVDHEAGRLAGLRDVAFQTADGLTLRGWYRAPQNGAVIVLAHGWKGTRQQMLSRANVLVRNGFGVLLFDFRAHGESEGELATSGDLERLDVTAALAFLHRQPEAHAARVGALGFSMGGAAVAEVAVREEGISAVMLEAVPPTLEEDIWQDYPTKRPLAPWVAVLVHRLAGVDVGAVRPIDRLCRISPRPLMLAYGEEDPGFPASTGRRMLAAACAPKSLWIVPHGKHGGYLELMPGEFEARTVRFFSTALLAPGAGGITSVFTESGQAQDPSPTPAPASPPPPPPKPEPDPTRLRPRHAFRHRTARRRDHRPRCWHGRSCPHRSRPDGDLSHSRLDRKRAAPQRNSAHADGRSPPAQPRELRSPCPAGTHSRPNSCSR